MIYLSKYSKQFLKIFMKAIVFTETEVQMIYTVSCPYLVLGEP